MAAYKTFLITYTMANGDVRAAFVKAPKYPTRKGMLKADAEVGVSDLRGEGNGIRIESSIIEIGTGRTPVTKVLWCTQGAPDQLLYSYTVTLEGSHA